ncbi:MULTISPECIES: fluoride efflux transporter CrcB [Thalassobaculum]|uniref:Fluoride-specific ion channel FluC n=1 Tax=Thalassobaculum litoreum DSM 18839 TaxID=1123362 RepID=A0A8G2BMG9_9PROT|nr:MULTISPECIES: fluoride efflux transporter CrcB [Thalassobaculum]SDG47260.1 camphor resistance protein CrcB [Thalassobaculum litoreum DSM 18839]
MKMLLAVALGGALGAVLRYKTVGWIAHLMGHGFPWGTLAVNVVGSFAMGALIELGALKLNLSGEMRAFLAVGLLGAFTTFSTFSLDVATLWERGAVMATGAYIAASVALSILALFAGLAFVRTVIA